jgi:hypothetical protein
MNDIRLIYKNYLDFYPTSKMTVKEKIMAIIRLLLYMTIISILVFRRVAIIFIIMMIIMIIIYYRMENEKKKECYKSTIDNPAMNVTYIDRIKNKERLPACKTDIKENIQYNLYENEKDINMTKNQERIFYTQPITTNMVDMKEYLEYIYGKNNKNCKEDRKCM